MYITVPLVTGYAFYSLNVHKHKGWYSWIISSLVGFIYAFGFVMMTPQLFINYKLKSVAHLPWKVVQMSLRTAPRSAHHLHHSRKYFRQLH